MAYRSRLGSRPLLAVALIAALIVVVLATNDARPPASQAAAIMDSNPPVLVPDSQQSGRVTARMRNVRYLVDGDIALAISGLRGSLVPAGKSALPVFDDPTSFAIEISDAVIAIDTASLGRLLTRYVFAYPGSPLRGLHVSIKDGELEQRGRLHKLISIPFSIRGPVSVTPEGEIEVAPRKVEVLGIGVKRLMSLFGVEMENLVKENRNHGVRIEGNVVRLDPGGMLPPPRIRGRLTALRLESDRIIQIFGRQDSAKASDGPLAAGTNFMFFRGGRLRFGKLTMADADLLIQDADSTSPLEFSLDRYHEQLVAGYHTTTPEDGLIVIMPDVSALSSRRTAALTPPGWPKVGIKDGVQSGSTSPVVHRVGAGGTPP